MLIYLLMGWACFLDIDALKTALPEAGFFWLIWGGVAYTIGVFFLYHGQIKVVHARSWHMAFFSLGGLQLPLYHRDQLRALRTH